MRAVFYPLILIISLLMTGGNSIVAQANCGQDVNPRTAQSQIL